MSDEITVMVFDTTPVVFYGNANEAKGYCQELGLKPTEYLPATNAPVKSDLLAIAMRCLREHGDKLEAFYDAVPLADLLADGRSQEDLYEVFDAARKLYKANRAANPNPDEMTDVELATWIDRQTGGISSW